ncbi:sigma 54-interacting transcriptional regulator [Lacrimispora celerecrescens]|uniref:sigma 54-interacting transcriptional regulator n=1 Tax=Lacrimispora celerecrescens TaxID=29354 RepID=UPI001FCB9CED|nr:sigma 54-interacting transcriptional regulator [Lacrimispora celerecrescens]
MRDKIKLIIGQEDKRNPLTDEAIANELGTLRENITKVRIETGIPASSERRKERLLQEIQGLFYEMGLVSDRKLAELLKQRGFKIGKFTVGQLHKSYPEIWEPALKSSQDETLDIDNKQEFQDDIFDKIIGSDGSLKNQISKAKAAVMYPPKGLHTLLYGPSGVGKSFLAELMHDFAVKTDNFQKEAPYFEFNCADYADNPQLLLAQLFGYTKGAFTGATDHKKGIVELCDGGILFLDEVHRLPAEGQEILFY